MQRVICRDMEPITPFIERVRELYDRFGISTIVAAGSSGAYFHVADHIIQMDRYEPKDITALAKQEAAAFDESFVPREAARKPDFCRRPMGTALPSDGRVKLKALGRDGFSINRETVDLRYVEQLCDGEQTAALGCCVLYAQRHLLDGKRTLGQVAEALDQVMARRTPAALCEGQAGVPFLARPRKQEIFACLNRMRSLRM